MISVIVAIARNRAIGFENRLLYRLPDDLKRFKALTTGHTIIIGRKTFESFPKGALPNRRNIVLSKNKAAVFPGAETFSSLQEALSHCKEEEEIFIIGGKCVQRSPATRPKTISHGNRRHAPTSGCFLPALRHPTMGTHTKFPT